MTGIVGSNYIIQIAIVVRDLEKTKRKFAEFLGLPVCKTIDTGKYEVSQTWYNGAPAPDANINMASYKVGPNLYLELMQPNGFPSEWQDQLDTHGEGIHHIAFQVKGMKEKIKACEEFGFKLMQKGEFAGANGRYAYVDSRKELKTTVELLEFDEPMEKIMGESASK